MRRRAVTSAEMDVLHRDVEELGRRVERLEASLRGRGARSGLEREAIRLVEQFAELAFALPQVQRVVLVADDDDLTIWTVIDAEPFDRDQRYPVYGAQARVLRDAECDAVDFRLINVREFGSDAADMMPRAGILWERSRSRDAAAL